MKRNETRRQRIFEKTETIWQNIRQLRLAISGQGALFLALKCLCFWSTGSPPRLSSFVRLSFFSLVSLFCRFSAVFLLGRLRSFFFRSFSVGRFVAAGFGAFRAFLVFLVGIWNSIWWLGWLPILVNLESWLYRSVLLLHLCITLWHYSAVFYSQAIIWLIWCGHQFYKTVPVCTLFQCGCSALQSSRASYTPLNKKSVSVICLFSNWFYVMSQTVFVVLQTRFAASYPAFAVSLMMLVASQAPCATLLMPFAVPHMLFTMLRMPFATLRTLHCSCE